MKPNNDTQPLTVHLSQEPIQRTGNFGARAHFQPEREPEDQLLALLYKVGARIQEATNDGRAYRIEIKVIANLTVTPWEAEIGEYVHRDHFPADLSRRPKLENPDNPTETRVFQDTLQGYQRIE